MKIKHSTLILFFISLMFIADGFNSILNNLHFSFFRVSIFVRFLAEAYFILLLLRTRQGQKTLLLFGGFMFLFALSAIAGIGLSSDYNLFENFNNFNKIAFFFLAFTVLRDNFPSEAAGQNLMRLFEGLILLQTGILLVSFIFHLKIFAAYLSPGDVENRFGYQGLIPAQNEVSGFYIIAFFYFLMKWDQRNGNLLNVVLVVLGALCTGTKVGLVVVPILLFYMIWSFGRSFLQRRGCSRSISLMIVIIALGGLAFWQWKYILERITPTLNYFSYFLHKGGYNIVDVLSSGRIIKLQLFSQVYLPNFSLVNYFIGGHDLSSFVVEMDVVDVFAGMGIIGAILFYWNYLNSLLLPARSHKYFVHILFVIVWLGVSTLAGHLVLSAVNATYLAILLLAFTYLTQKEGRETDSGGISFGQDSLLSDAKRLQ